MKYLVEVEELQSWTTFYEVKADSAKEAEENYTSGEIIHSEYNYIDNSYVETVRERKNED